MLAAVQQAGEALQCTSDEMKNDPEVAMVAVQQNPDALQYVSDSLKGDARLVLVAINKSPAAIQCLGLRFFPKTRHIRLFEENSPRVCACRYSQP